MTGNDRAKRRPRRIAADEAHAWARNLRLRNTHAKLVLSMLSLYVDGDGFAFVSIPELGEDCELSADTVRRRLQWLEDIGAIARTPQWIDRYGRRTGTADSGKRTTDLIQLLYLADADEIEARAAGNMPENPVNSTSFSPSQQQGLNSTRDSVSPPVSPAPALRQPSHCSEGLISEPEPEPESPLRPPTGGESENSFRESEPDDFGPAWLAWPGHEAMRRDLALAEFRQLSPEKQKLCRMAVPLFAAALVKLGRTRVTNFHLWIRAKGFEEFPNAAASPNSAGSEALNPNSTAGKAVLTMHAVARTKPFEGRHGIVYAGEITAQVLKFADADPSSEWLWIEDRQQIAAWLSFIAGHVRIARPPLVVMRGRGDDQRNGIYAPWPWPPRKDGKLSQENTGDAA